MARAKLLRQYVEDYQRKVAGVNEQVEAANTAYQGAYQGYSDRANAYNAWVDQVKAGSSAGLYQYEPGKWAALVGDRFANTTKRGNAWDSSALYNSVDELKQAGPWGTAGYVRNSDGTASYYTPQQTNVYTSNDGTPVDTQGWTLNGEGGWTPPFGWGENPMPQVLSEGVNTTTVTEYVPYHGLTYRLMEFTEQAPAAPVAPEPVREPSFTRANMKEMANPGLSQAQLSMARAQGFEGKSELKGDEMTAPTSAFANEDDPNNLKEKGILARVMGGQL